MIHTELKIIRAVVFQRAIDTYDKENTDYAAALKEKEATRNELQHQKDNMDEETLFLHLVCLIGLAASAVWLAIKIFV